MPSVKYEWNKTHVDILAINESSTKTVKRITHFFKTLDIKGIGESTVEKFVNAGYTSLFDIINNQSKLTQIKGIGSKTIENLFNNLKIKLSESTVDQIMAASCIFGRGFGTRITKKIIDTYPSILQSDWSEDFMIDQLCKITGFDKINATKFSTNFNQFLIFYNKLSSLIQLPNKHLSTESTKSTESTNSTESTKSTTCDFFKNQVIVFSGIRNKEWEKNIELMGGKVGSSVSKNTTIVVYKDKTTAKYKKALEIGVKTIEYDDFQKFSNIYL